MPSYLLPDEHKAKPQSKWLYPVIGLYTVHFSLLGRMLIKLKEAHGGFGQLRPKPHFSIENLFLMLLEGLFPSLLAIIGILLCIAYGQGSAARWPMAALGLVAWCAWSWLPHASL